MQQAIEINKCLTYVDFTPFFAAINITTKNITVSQNTIMASLEEII